MALVTNGWTLSVTLGGIDDSTATRNYNLQGTDYDAAVINRTAILAGLDAVSDGVVKSHKLSEGYAEDAYSRPTAATTETGDAAIITGEIAGDVSKSWTLSVPYPIAAMFLAAAGKNYNNVDIANTALIAYKNIFNTHAYISDGEETGNIVSGKRA
jgi:hypothetical protein